jgi:hypothetical protein
VTVNTHIFVFGLKAYTIGYHTIGTTVDAGLLSHYVRLCDIFCRICARLRDIRFLIEYLCPSKSRICTLGVFIGCQDQFQILLLFWQL